MIQIPLSQIASASAFAGDVERHCAALKKHQMGAPGLVAPEASPLVSLVIARRPQDGPVDKRGPDDFVVLPYEVKDDMPPATPELTLADQKAFLEINVRNAGAAAKAAVLSPARAQLLRLDAADAMLVPESAQSLAQRTVIDAYSTYLSQCAVIDREVLRVLIEVEELTEANVQSWTLPDSLTNG